MPWGPDSERVVTPSAATPKPLRAGDGRFRLRDAVIIIAGMLIGQFLGPVFYVSRLASELGIEDDDRLFSVAYAEPYLNHLVLVTILYAYLLMLPWILILLYVRRITLREIGLVRTERRWFGFALLFFLALYGISAGLMHFLDAEKIEAIYRTMGGLVSSEPAWAVLSVLLVVVIGPVLQEIAFRSALFHGLSRHMPRLAAAALSVAVFVVIQLQYTLADGVVASVTSAQVAMLGAALMFLYMKSGSLWPGIALHALNNGVSLIFFFVLLQH